MKFTIRPESIERLQLDPERAGVVFDGPSTREGLIGGMPRGVLKWAKQQLKIDRIEYLDVAEARLLYYVISIRNADHTLLPISRFDDLALDDFELVPHVMRGKDQDGDCADCNQPWDSPVHVTADDDGPAPDEVPPTQGPDSPETTGTPTG